MAGFNVFLCLLVRHMSYAIMSQFYSIQYRAEHNTFLNVTYLFFSENIEEFPMIYNLQFIQFIGIFRKLFHDSHYLNTFRVKMWRV